MATKNGAWVRNAYRVNMQYTYSETDTTTTITVSAILEARAGGAGGYASVSASASADGTKQTGSWSGNLNTIWGSPVTLCTATKTITKTHASQTASCVVTALDSGAQLYSLSSSISVNPKTSYAVTYYANGGSGAPSPQTKWYGETLTLSTAKPTPPTGRIFLGWATTSGGTPTYGQPYTTKTTYTGNQKLDLYAIYGYTVRLKVTGESGYFSSLYKIHGKAITLPSATPSVDGQTFLGWNTSQNGTGTSYAASGSYATDADATLYAVLVGVSAEVPVVTRTDQDGTPTDDGTYAKVEGTWEVHARLTGTVAVTGRYKPKTGGSWTSIGTIDTESKTGTADLSGSSDSLFGGAPDSATALDLATTYSVELTVTFSYTYNGASGTASKVVTGILDMAYITMEFLAGGHGVTFGHPATESGLHSYMPATFHDGLQASNIGTLANGNDTMNVQSDTGTAICSVTLAAGVWLVLANAKFAANDTGVRLIDLSSTSADVTDATATQTGSKVDACGSGATYLHTSFAISRAYTTTMYLNAWQTSGAALSVTGYIRAMRIQ